MKKIRVKVEQNCSSDKRTVANSNVEICIDGKKVENNVIEIIDNALEKRNDTKYRIYNCGSVYVDVTFKSGIIRVYKFDFDAKKEFIDSTLDMQLNKERLEKLKEFIQRIEKEVEDAYKNRCCYFLEV